MSGIITTDSASALLGTLKDAGPGLAFAAASMVTL
jgi:hypothetical protein